jgi:hypothetical protein
MLNMDCKKCPPVERVCKHEVQIESPIVPNKLEEALKVITEHPHGLQDMASQPSFLSVSVSCDAKKNSIILTEEWVKKEDLMMYVANCNITKGEIRRCLGTYFWAARRWGAAGVFLGIAKYSY